MLPDCFKGLVQNKSIQFLVIALFSALTAWWIVSRFVLGNANDLTWAASYQAVALFGALFGFVASSYWGGLKSLLGRSIFFYSLGLLFQVFGQSSFSYYNLVAHVEVPYPSVADIGYFGSIPLYIYATLLLVRVSGGVYSLKTIGNKMLAVAIPVIILLLSYYFFLQGYEFTDATPLRVFLDFGYPLGQAMYVSIALVTYLLSRSYLGGVMKNSLLVILFALAVQYVADYNFLYQALNETWSNGGYGDFLYLFAYFVMAMGLVNLGHMFLKLK